MHVKLWIFSSLFDDGNVCIPMQIRSFTARRLVSLQELEAKPLSPLASREKPLSLPNWWLSKKLNTGLMTAS